MLRGFNAELKRVALFTALCLLFGLINGYVLPTLLAGGGLYMFWMLWQIRQLDIWLNQRRKTPPPEASGIWSDIFESIYRLQKRQERESERVRQVLNRVQETTGALPDGVLLLDSRGNIDWWNPAAERMFGFEQSDQGQPLVNYVRNPKFVSYMEKQDFREPLDIPASGNKDNRLQFQVTRYGQNEKLVVARDITYLHKLGQMRKDFVANVSHELRTPLTVLKGYLETFADAAQLPENFHVPLTQMQQQCTRMHLLVNDLISLSVLETEVNLERHQPLALKPLLERLRDEAAALSADKQIISLSCDDNIKIHGVEKELQSAFGNLVNNAVKYTQTGARIHINATVDHYGLRVAVTDNGPGIEPRHLPRLTERFYRVDDSRNSATGGTGLGLAIVKHALSRHDGRLEITSQVGQGSAFICHFPKQRLA
ncbi:phosphate regulon sensor histidine kinase PhoR [Simiduia sp. 21SJ11W-1]|uniref:phosphate regulon sensor histidine kinase PhoR n=1 Tax=Simiduia sp. 21SJ11W-1 TaxID=2909669 RepID=UPI00209D56A5|nr:phosphate regulon sensor histidine kinase PhoR [Simiduia sp. 21SJ11W-1]UTA47978.1 phosphate regulon sensor histidine kinase PhoR [Simiduia sp. 21SJ11W-1]